MERLEDKVKEERADWKQWVPGFGIFKMVYDMHYRKPSVVDGKSKTLKCAFLLYHTVPYAYLIDYLMQL